MNKHKHRLSLQRKASMRRMRPFRGAKGLTRPVAVRAQSGLSYPFAARWAVRWRSGKPVL